MSDPVSNSHSRARQYTFWAALGIVTLFLFGGKHAFKYETGRVVTALGIIGSKIVRGVIGTLAGFPLLIIACALLPSEAKIVVAPLITLLPLAVFVLIVLINRSAAMLTGVAGTIMLLSPSKKLLQILQTIAIGELLLGLYFSLIPVGNDLKLIPLLLLAIIGLPFMRLEERKELRFIPISILVFLTLIFMLGGRALIHTTSTAVWATTQTHARSALAQINPSTHLSEQPSEGTPIVPPVPADCMDAASRDTESLGDYRSAHITYFDAPSTGGCMGEVIYVPNAWNHWRMETVSGTNCATWLWIQGGDPIFINNEPLPSSLANHSPFRIASNCTIRVIDTN